MTAALRAHIANDYKNTFRHHLDSSISHSIARLGILCGLLRVVIAYFLFVPRRNDQETRRSYGFFLTLVHPPVSDVCGFELRVEEVRCLSMLEDDEDR